MPAPINVYENDLPDGLDLGLIVAIDTETMGLNPHRDRLCLVQMSAGDGVCHAIRVGREPMPAPNLARLLGDSRTVKLMHFARFDLAILYKTFGVMPQPVYCTKVASRLVRTFTDRHGLKDLVRELVGVELLKQQQSSDWGREELMPEQLSYAANDVLYLHEVRQKLDAILQREGRMSLADACFKFLPTRALLDLSGWDDIDIFQH